MGMPSPEELTEKTTALRKWGDDQQYEAEPFEGGGGDSGVQPKVTLLNMTSRPLATLAAFCAMYKGVAHHIHGTSSLQQSIDAIHRECHDIHSATESAAGAA